MLLIVLNLIELKVVVLRTDLMKNDIQKSSKDLSLSFIRKLERVDDEVKRFKDGVGSGGDA